MVVEEVSTPATFQIGSNITWTRFGWSTFPFLTSALRSWLKAVNEVRNLNHCFTKKFAAPVTINEISRLLSSVINAAKSNSLENNQTWTDLQHTYMFKAILWTKITIFYAYYHLVSFSCRYSAILPFSVVGAYSHFRLITFFIDGGSIRGLSGLVMLHEMMSRIEFDQGLDCTPKPRDYFNMIAGGGTGGYEIVLSYYSLDE